jgi:hypothetical protein
MAVERFRKAKRNEGIRDKVLALPDPWISVGWIFVFSIHNGTR